MSIVPLNVGAEANDGTGQNLRSGGIIINANFAELDTRTGAAQASADKAVADAATALVKANAAVPGSAVGVSVAQLVGGVVPATQLPSVVGDVLDFPTRADFPVTGVSGKIYIAINDGDSPSNPTRQWRWSGTAYVVIPSSPGSTDQVPEGPTNLYFTAARVRSTALAGLGALVNTAILASDTILQAFAKLQGQINVKLGAGDTAVDSAKLNGQSASFYTATMTGATASTDGVKGLVPAPPAGGAVRVLSSLGTWIAQAAGGGVWGAISGNLTDQTDLKSALDAKATLSSLPVTKKWVSTDTAWTNAGTINVSHTLGVPWTNAILRVRYKVALNGMSIGETSQISSFVTTVAGAGNFGVEIRKPTTTGAVLQVASNGIYSVSATGAAVALTPAQADLVVELWA